jgi:hypothetical protein
MKNDSYSKKCLKSMTSITKNNSKHKKSASDISRVSMVTIIIKIKKTLVTKKNIRVMKVNHLIRDLNKY